MAERILLVEDDPRLAEMLCEYLGQAGMRVTVAPLGATALKRLSSADYDALVLDLMLPDMDGLEVCRRVRTGSDTPGADADGAGRCDRSHHRSGARSRRLPSEAVRASGVACAPARRSATPHPRSRITAAFRSPGDRCAPPEPSDWMASPRVDLASVNLLLALAENAGRVLSRDALMDLVKGEALESLDRLHRRAHARHPGRHRG